MRFAFAIIFPILLALFVFVDTMAQSANPITNRGYYRTQNSGGVLIHTRGIGMYYRRGWRTSGFSNRIFNAELLTLRHPKEFKLTNPGANNSRGYFYGKLNSVVLLRGSYGWQKVMFDKEVKRGVRVSIFTLFGPTIGLAKPVYVDFKPNDTGNSRAQIVRYSTSLHNSGDVEGRAAILYKMGTTKIYPGGHAKFALNFEYSADDAFIRALETGSTLDVFAKRIPIMENTYNDQFYLTLYISFHFGKRYL